MSTSTTEIVSVVMTDLVDTAAIAGRTGSEAVEELRVEHFGLLREGVQRTGGREVKSLGDGLMVVFQSATHALSCAVEMQRLVEARNRRAEEQVGVRIGVSLGEATVEEGDYFGEPAVESARLCAAADGGQILVTAMVRRIAGTHDGHRFSSIGELALKGISEPVPAYELHWVPLLATGIALPQRLRELPDTGYVGREAERRLLRELWMQAREGSLRVALVSGEAGVGKTRLAGQLAGYAREGGATVLYGRCDEDLGVPYLPWAQALGHLVREARRAILETHVERHGGDLTRLVGDLGDRLPDLSPPRQSDPETERYLLYAAVAGLLEVAGDDEPLLLVLDDLQWADQPTLSLLRHVTSTGGSLAVMVIGIYRDSDLSREHPLTALLSELHHEQGSRRIELAGLDSEAVQELLEALTEGELEAGRELARAITSETAGNPFFASELVRHLTESGAIVEESGRSRVVGDVANLGLPQSVREVTGRRVERLGPDARTALSAASVIGRDFDLELLLAVVDLPHSRLLDLLDEAVAASLLQESSEQPDRFTFTHALVVHTLYEDLGRARRGLLHRHVAEALERQCGAEPGERLGELAGHWAAAAGRADGAKALHYSRRAAERALDQLAPDEAIRWYRQALELHGKTAAGDPSERCELLIGLGEAQRQSAHPGYRQTLLDAAELAQELDDSDRLARAVLANSRGWTRFGALDAERVRALEASEQALPKDDPRRAQVLAVLASELHFAVEPARCQALAEEAIEIARAGGDPAALAHTLNSTIWTIWVPDSLEQRRRMADELVELAESLHDPRLSFWAAARSVMIALETGERSRVEAGLQAMRSLSALLPQPSILYMLAMLDFGRLLLDGELAAAEGRAIEAYEIGIAAEEPGAERTYFAQRFHLHHLGGRAGRQVEPAVEFADRPDSACGWRAGAALALIESGRADEARERLLAEDFQDVPWDQAWLPAVHTWADACGRLGVVDRAAELYELMAPFPGRLVGQAGVVYGSVDWALGALAGALGHHEDAERHFIAAAAIDERVGAPLLLARTHTSRARALIERGRPEDLDRAGALLEQAGDTAALLRAGGITRQIAECHAAAALSR